MVVREDLFGSIQDFDGTAHMSSCSGGVGFHMIDHPLLTNGLIMVSGERERERDLYNCIGLTKWVGEEYVTLCGQKNDKLETALGYIPTVPFARFIYIYCIRK